MSTTSNMLATTSLALGCLAAVTACRHEQQAPPKPLLGTKSPELISKFQSACPGAFGVSEFGGLHCTLSGLKAYGIYFDDNGRIRQVSIDFHRSDDDIARTFDLGLSALFAEPTRAKLRNSITDLSNRVVVQGGFISIVRTPIHGEDQDLQSLSWHDD